MTIPITTLPAAPWADDVVTDEALGDPSSILVYAEPGVGKTSLIGQLVRVPGFERGLYIDIDNGTKVWNDDPYVKQAIAEGRLVVVKIDKTKPDAFAKVHNYTQDAINVDRGFNWVGLDSLDVAQEVGVKWFLANTFNEQGKQDTRAAWGRVSEWTSDLAWGFQNAPHFMGVLVGHSKVDEDKKTGQSSVKPKLAGSMKDNIASIPDLVFYMWKEKLEDGNLHRILASDGDDFVAKSRFSTALPERLVDPTMTQVFSLLRGEAAAATAAIAA